MEQYINKDAIVTEIETMKSAAEVMLIGKTDLSYWKAQKHLCEKLLSYLDTLETKEVDLEKEYDNNFFNDPVYSKPVNRNAGIGLAKHFFSLGLRTQKGEFKKESETEYPNFDEAQGTPITK